MAHKIKVKPVPHINRDGSVGTKKDYIVRCKRRGHVCVEQKFSTRREADALVAEHWDYVTRRKNSLRQYSGRGIPVRVRQRVQNFQSHLDHKRKRRHVKSEDFVNPTTTDPRARVRFLEGKTKAGAKVAC